jgi:predicted metalloendopeptidase
MKSLKLKKINDIKNKTRKHRVDVLESIMPVLTTSQRDIVCKQFSNTYNTFEDKVEEIFKKNNVDFNSTNYNLEKQIISDLKKAVSPSKITPQDNFYSYINDRWLKDYELQENQKYIVQVDDFRIVQDKVYRELIEIIENYISNPKTKNTKKALCIKNAYESFKNANTDEQQKCVASAMLELIDELRKNKENLWKMLATMNKNEIISWSTPFVWSLNPDDKNPKFFKCCLESPQLTLIDLDIYFDDGKDVEYKKKYKKIYFKYLTDVFENSFGPNNGFNVNDIFNCEVKLINAMSCSLIKTVDSDNYNVVTKEEAMKLFNFNWEQFTRELGYEKTPDEFITSNINYLLCGTKLMLEEWDSPEWRTYWIYMYIKQQQRWCDKGRETYYNFNGNFVRGQERIVDPYITPVFTMSFLFNTFLTNEYIEKYKNEQNINYVKTMAEDLKTVFIRIIKRNKWMAPKTKKKALEKLKKFNLIVGSPEILTEDPLLDYKPDDAWGNLIKMSEWRLSEAIRLTGKKVVDKPVIDWSQTPPKFIGTQAYVVNASYTPSKNGIYIPLGYIQKPFVDLDERGIEYNLTRIGFTIAHEMSHALDDWGSKYDENGVLNNWWTEKDKKHFKAIQTDVVKQYETFAAYDGIKFDAWPSIGEDLADISGITICREYLRDFQLKNEDILPIQKLSFESFFIYFAVQSRQKISRKSILAQLKTNPHPLDKYRCNVPLSRLTAFRTIFDIKKGDKMWWHSTNRVWED